VGRFTRLLALAVGVVSLGWAAAGCGGRAVAPIRIGVLADCEGLFATVYEAAITGAELPLLRRGARLAGTQPSDGIADATVAGKPVELVIGCVREFQRASTLAALRLLVERDRVDVVLGPNGPADGLVVRDYAKRRPKTTFIYAGFDGAATLVAPAPNVFRFRVTMAQWAAGLGAYAYHVLGWRRAVTIGNIEPGPAGFIAEFCSLGGTIVQRLWQTGPDLGSLVRRIPHAGVDGVFLPTSLYNTESFVTAWYRRHHDLGRWLVVGDGAFTSGAGDRRLVGVVASNPTPWAPVPSWTSYVAQLRRAFPRSEVSAQDALDFYNAMEATLEALEHVHGDLGASERRLMRALAGLRYASPEGPRTLDRFHQAIANSYLGKMVVGHNGKLAIRQIRVVRGVDQTFGGHLTATTPIGLTANEPPCTQGNPPPWAR
jgi:branched-chain amino acid transport system substrate-binding protein